MSYSGAIETYFSPDDAVSERICALVQGAQERIDCAMYGFHLPMLTDLLIQKHQAGVRVRLILDHTQAEGRAERAEVERLRSAQVPLRIGTSTHHRIMHSKYLIIDRRLVESGSFNFSLSAEDEANFIDIIEAPARVALFEQNFNQLWDWIGAHEPQWQSATEGEGSDAAQ